MSISKILSYMGLGVVGALLIVVVILSFVTTKMSITVSATNTLGSAVAVAPSQISVSKYDGTSSKELGYKMFEEDNTKFQDYNSVISNFNAMGSFSIMQKLFLGIGDSGKDITYEKTKTFNQLHKETDVYMVEFSWNEKQKLLKVDGTAYKNADGDDVTFTKLAILVDNSNKVGDYLVYVKTYTYDSSYSYYHYNITANVYDLYKIAAGFDADGKLQTKFD